MRFALKHRSKAPTLSLTSMLDVIFLLLFYFAAMSIQSQWESDIKVSLPEARSAETPDRLPGELVLNVHTNGTVVVNNMELAPEELQARLRRIAEIYPEQTAIIRADKGTEYEKVVAVIDTCRSAGVWNFALASKGAAGEEQKGASAP